MTGGDLARRIFVHGGRDSVARRSGWWGWLLQRVTGLALLGYLFMHIAVISTSQGGPEAFDQVLRVLQTPLFVVLDLGLLATVVYHMLNGLRVVLFDMGIGIAHQAALFWLCIVTTALITGVAFYVSVPLIFKG